MITASVPDAALVITRDWSVLWCRVASQVEKHFIHVTPAPTLGRIVTLDDQVTGRTIVSGGMTTWRLIAAPHVSASPADPKVNPYAAGFQTLLAAARAGGNLPYGAKMSAAFTHYR
jgi:hypothetical protein